jgi:putative hydrolase
VLTPADRFAHPSAYHALVTEPGPGDDPFRGVPFLGDLARMLQGQGPLNWDAARQFALMIATEGASEQNIDPSLRFQYQELGRIADLHVQQVTGLETVTVGRAVEVVPVTRGTWAQHALDAYRPLFQHLAGTLGAASAATATGLGNEEDEPGLAMFGGLMQMLAPMMLGMSVGSMVGHLSRRSFGQYDLPIPRPASPEVHVVSATVDEFGEAWSLPLDDLRLWVSLQEIASHAVLTIPHVRTELESLLMAYVAGFQPNPDALGDKLAALDPTDTGGLADLQQVLGDPEVLLGAMQSPAQRALLPRLDALVATVIGYVDHTVDVAARGLVATAPRIAEAARRRRVESDQSDVFVARLLGLTLTQQAVERGQAFVAGVLERDGDLSRLWQSVELLPTPAEVDAPGLWLARIDL